MILTQHSWPAAITWSLTSWNVNGWEDEISSNTGDSTTLATVAQQESIRAKKKQKKQWTAEINSDAEL